MNVLKFDETRLSTEILKELEGKKFFAVSISDGIFSFHVPGDMMRCHVVHGCEMLKMIVLNDSIVHEDKMEN